MENTSILASVSSITYFIISLIANKYSTEKKAPKHILIDACIVFLSIIISCYMVDFIGYDNKKGISMTAAFTSKPDF